MAVDVLTEIEIDRSAAVMAAYACDPDHVPDWYVNIKSVEWKTPRPVVLGSKLGFVAHFLGRRITYTYEVTELVVGARLVMRTAEGPFPMETTYAFEPLTPTRTRMTMRNRGAPAGFGLIVGPLMSAAIRRATSKDLARLKRLLESAP